MTGPTAWVDLDGIFYPIFEENLALVEKIFTDALLKISQDACQNYELRQLRLPIDFYEKILLDYEKIRPEKRLIGMIGTENCKIGDIVFRVDFEGMKVHSEISKCLRDIQEEVSKVATGELA